MGRSHRNTRFIGLLLAGLLLSAMTACGDDDDEQRSTPSASASGTTAPTTASSTGSTASPSPEPTDTVEPKPGWQDRVDRRADNGVGDADGQLSVQVVGGCTADKNDGMLLDGHGPANGTYTQSVTGPDGQIYEYFDAEGRFDENGQTSGWSWNCFDTDTGKRDPKGAYILNLTDTTPGSETQNETVTARFSVGYKD